MGQKCRWTYQVSRARNFNRAGQPSLRPQLADLTELGRTPVAVVSSGCKSFLDIPKTLEYLETEGVLVGTFADGRKGHVDYPAFWTRESGVPSPKVIENELDAAAMIRKSTCAGYLKTRLTLLLSCSEPAGLECRNSFCKSGARRIFYSER